ncbi:MAG: hypothetical protein PHU78_10565 [Heliobacteriaceae bacterium]|nr:hypothetical protein [Heliobacteriaceae bacterium]
MAELTAKGGICAVIHTKNRPGWGGRTNLLVLRYGFLANVSFKGAFSFGVLFGVINSRIGSLGFVFTAQGFFTSLL